MRTKRGNRRVKQDAQNRREHCWCRKRWLQSQQKYPHPPSEKGRGAAEVQVTKSVNHPRGPPGSLERQAQWEIQGEHPEVETKNRRTSESKCKLQARGPPFNARTSCCP